MSNAWRVVRRAGYQKWCRHRVCFRQGIAPPQRDARVQSSWFMDSSQRDDSDGKQRGEGEGECEQQANRGSHLQLIHLTRLVSTCFLMRVQRDSFFGVAGEDAEAEAVVVESATWAAESGATGECRGIANAPAEEVGALAACGVRNVSAGGGGLEDEGTEEEDAAELKHRSWSCWGARWRCGTSVAAAIVSARSVLRPAIEAAVLEVIARAAVCAARAFRMIRVVSMLGARTEGTESRAASVEQCGRLTTVAGDIGSRGCAMTQMRAPSAAPLRRACVARAGSPSVRRTLCSPRRAA